jgi:hypothetical protein
MNRCFVAAALAATLVASRAWAADPKLQGVGEAGLGYLDTVQSAPDGAPGTVSTRGVVVLLSPGLLLTLTSPRNVQRVGYRYQHDFFIGSTTASTSTNRLDYLGFFDLSPRVGLLLDARVVETSSYSSFTFAPPGTELLAPLPLGAGSFLLGGAGETFTFEVAPDWRAWQGGTIVAQTPILGSEGPRSVSTGARLGIERVFPIDAVGVEARTTYTVIADGVRPDGSRAEIQRQLVSAGVGIWRHDWGRDFASRVEAGVLRLDRLNTGTGFWSPTGTAALAYVTPYGDAELSYTHTVTMNPVLGQTLLVDEVRLRGGLPLTEDGRLSVATTLAYQKGRIVDEDADLEADVNVLVADVGLGWQATRNLAVGLRYQHIEQRSDTSLPGLPLRFVQNGVMAGAVFKLPSDTEMPRSYRAPRRIDGTDEIRDTVRPARDDVRPEVPRSDVR